jgi:selenocysteine-specific elongation factor
MAEAELRLLATLPGPLEDYAEVQLHIGTASAPAHVAMLETTRMTAGQRQMVQLRLPHPLPLVPGDRFVVRANVPDPVRGGLATLGGGRILGVSNVRLRRQKPWTIAALQARREAIDDPPRWCELRVRECGAPVVARDLRLEMPLRPDETAGLLEQLRAQGRLRQTASGAWVHTEVRDHAAEALLTELRAFHAAHPERAGLARETLRTALALDGDLLDSATIGLVEQGRIQRIGDLLAVAGWQAQIPDRDQQLLDQLATELGEAAWTPPSLEELASALGQSPERIVAVLRLLADRGLAVRLDERVWMHRDAVEAGGQVALKLFRRAPSFSTMEFRDALGVSRKFAVPLLDHLDRLRFTVRAGHQRTPGVEAKKALAEPPAATSW